MKNKALAFDRIAHLSMIEIRGIERRYNFALRCLAAGDSEGATFHAGRTFVATTRFACKRGRATLSALTDETGKHGKKHGALLLAALGNVDDALDQAPAAKIVCAANLAIASLIEILDPALGGTALAA